MTSREEFEAWYKTDPPESDKFWHDNFFTTAQLTGIKEQMWEAWQAARVKKDEDTLRPEYNLTELKPIIWEYQLMYKHRGERIPRFEILGQEAGPNRIVAKEKGTVLAEKWLKEKFPKGDEIESWEVKARPAKTA